MRYYEKIFPKDIEIFLFTTDKYDGAQSKNLSSKWELKKTKVHVSDYSILKTPIGLRKFCRKNKINRLVNLGTPGAAIPFILATIGTKTDFLIGYYGEALRKHELKKKIHQKIRAFLNLPLYFIAAHFAKKINFIIYNNYKAAPIFFMKNPRNIYYSHAPVNINRFYPKNKLISRKKLKLQENKKIILLVGRINHGKCADIYKKLAELNSEIQFIMIGKWLEHEIPRFNLKNLQYFERKSPEELLDYYNSADLVFCMHRDGTQMGIVAEEALSCGIPIIHSDKVFAEDSDAILKLPYSAEKISNEIKLFFSLSKKQKDQLSKKAREYALENLSDEVWKERYLDFFLN